MDTPWVFDDMGGEGTMRYKVGWAVEISRKDKTTFLASGVGVFPMVWCKNQRKKAVEHKKDWRGHGFKCKVVQVKYILPMVV